MLFVSFATKIFGDSNKRFLKKIEPIVESINKLEPEAEKLSGDELKQKTSELKKRLDSSGGSKERLDSILPEVFSLVREAAKRTLKQRHFDVQLIGGIILHQGKIAEMKTGEGKTLVATLPACLNALDGKGVHIVTVNDYLARRDVVWMGQIYDALGLSVGCINHEASYLYDPTYQISQQGELDKIRDELGSFKVVHEFLRPCSRQEAYQADILYGTNNEFGFDYLRDNLVYGANQISQKFHHYAIIDEIDSILIDEARTPLIISAPAEESSDFYVMFSKIAEKLEENRDYVVDEKLKAVSLAEEGIERAEKLLGVKDIYTEKGIKYVHHLETAVRAKALFVRDKDYVVKNGEIIIVDEFTGRLMPGRRWSEGLHQAIEAKEDIGIQKESRTLASITFQNYFRMYEKLSGMTGTALTSAEEFHKVYNLETIAVPTNVPLRRKNLPDLIFQTEKGKFKAVAKKIKELHEKGQPVLVGTVSIDKNEKLSAMLNVEGAPHKILNAKNHEQEGEIIAQAGRKGQVTIATNMAGRGVDIILGGNPSNSEDARQVRESGGLFVLGTERHEARRIDDQLRGRAGRQGDPGETQFFVSLEDELMRVFGPERIKNMMNKFGIPEDHPIENKFVTNAIESAQSKIEGFNFDTRKHLLEYDDVISHQRKIIYERRKKILLGDNDYIFNELKNIAEPSQLEKLRQDIGDEKFFNAERVLMLQAIDMLWVGHLEVMDYMRSSVRLRAYGQRDPLVEYKNESLRLFRELESAINSTIASMALRVGSAAYGNLPSSRLGETSADAQFGNSAKSGNQIGKVGRNDPCPCGAKKPDGTSIKYKHCCGN
ncbi:preprotein translocase subunit SecA [Patescibacteria group bacterium]|nr:preprotein translocase subunit SecA [Patescibacteria group bacterium]MBU4353317.1 preprotein translocase subunit SecA [Patescibacteria group bacterium]MBU4477078.1 preprotein translocase subunit SecA [Patescibacteria group bacterium]MCG2698994.1 preprotein translocase subunit SecA [Candidatus Parcubacteria bacterium]